MNPDELREKIKGIVNYQFGGITNLTPKAYKDSLEIIARQILQACKEAGIVDPDKLTLSPKKYHRDIYNAHNTEAEIFEEGKKNQLAHTLKELEK